MLAHDFMLNRLLNIIYMIETFLVLVLWRRRWQKGNRFYGIPHFSGSKKISYGDDFICVSRTGKNSLGVIQRTRITVFPTSSGVFFGDKCGVSGVAISSRAKIVIGNSVLIGSGAMILDNDAHGILPHEREIECCVKKAPIIIEDDVFIGARAIILKGVTIGRGAIIGAGSVVVGNIPAWSIAVGNPARVVKEIKVH